MGKTGTRMNKCLSTRHLSERLKASTSETLKAHSITMMRLWQLISPSLPIGAYAYSQGLESAVDKGWVNNETQAQEWIGGLLQQSLSQLDAPILLRCYQAWQHQDHPGLEYWNHYLLACRESSELYQEDLQMGLALKRLLRDILNENDLAEHDRANLHHMAKLESPSYIVMFAFASHIWKIPLLDALHGFLWSWCENQVAAGIKLIPLGQTAGQRILSHLIGKIEQGSQLAFAIKDDQIGALAPGFAIACAQHENQYSRLFRS